MAVHGPPPPGSGCSPRRGRARRRAAARRAAALLLLVPVLASPPALRTATAAEPAQARTPVEQAWDAWTAAEAQERAAVPRLLQRLERALAPEVAAETPAPTAPRGGATEAEAAARLQARWPLVAVLLDALTRLEAEVPAPTLLAARQSHAAHVAVHLVRRLAWQRAAALAVFDAGCAQEHLRGDEELAFLALGAALGRARTPGFAARLLRAGRLERTVRVESPPPPGAVAAPSPPPRGGVAWDGWHRVPAGFPPVAVPRLATEPGPGRVLLSPGLPGTPDVFVARGLEQGERIGFGGSGPGLAPADACWAWTRALLPADRAAGLPPREETWVLRWVARTPYVRTLAARLHALETGWYAALAALAEQGWLSAAEAAGLAPDLRLRVEDARSPPHRPLPPVPASGCRNPFAPAAPRGPTVRAGV